MDSINTNVQLIGQKIVRKQSKVFLKKIIILINRRLKLKKRRVNSMHFDRDYRRLLEKYYPQKRSEKEPWYLWVSLITLLVATLLIMASYAHAETIHAETIPDDVAIKCILGEVRGEYHDYGYNALLANAEALRNRGTTQGVYGCKAHFDHELSYLKRMGIFENAVKAWKESAHSNLVKGASYWGSLIVDQKWIKEMKRKGYKETYRIGNTAYYKQ